MKDKKKKIFKIYFFIFFYFVLIFFLFLWNVELFVKYSRLNDKKIQQDSEMEESLKFKEDIEKDLEFLETDKGKEKVLIEKNNLKKPGERVIKILDY